jgi:glycyl-tRNA synthetase beta chain
MGELLLELLSEEIPARMQRRAIDGLVALVRDKLAAAEIPAQTLRGYVTPRRLTIIADGIPTQQPDRREERRGPRIGAPQQALDGFLRAAGLQSIEQCEIRGTDRGEFYFAVMERPGRATAEVLPELLCAAIGELAWPTSMRFPAAALRWVRPLTSVICLFDGAVLALPLDQIPIGRTTRGHRFLSEGEIAVENAADYLDKLEAAHVVLDPDRRRNLIMADLDRFAAAEGLAVKPDPALLDEVMGLVEYPVVLMGRIDGEFVRPLPDGLPPEVLATAMRTHQKYFSCLKSDGTPAPRFLFVANNLTDDHGKTIIAGNERVLRARLADARFFWEQDRKVRLAERVEALKRRVYYDKLGSMYDKTLRMELIAEFLALGLNGDSARARSAARLSKADLSTSMVGEFPELQGIMGRYYALEDDEDLDVADAIADHYRPLGPNDTCPSSQLSVITALADKLDSLARFFWIGERPTGSGDPFALRRAALGVIRIILENELHLPLTSVLNKAVDPLPEYPPDKVGQIVETLMHFFGERLAVQFRAQGVRHDLINAVLMTKEDDLIRVLARVRALDQFIASADGANLLTAYRRASNIVSIEERRDQRSYHDALYSLLRQDEERTLWHTLDPVAEKTAELIADAQFEGAMSVLATLRPPVDEFFDKVTVNTDDSKLRENRLRLLSRIRAVMNQVADFSQIEG